MLSLVLEISRENLLSFAKIVTKIQKIHSHFIDSKDSKDSLKPKDSKDSKNSLRVNFLNPTPQVCLDDYDSD